jgi:hypothetical protein
MNEAHTHTEGNVPARRFGEWRTDFGNHIYLAVVEIPENVRIT